MAPDSAFAAAFEHVAANLRSAGCVFAEDEARLLLSAFPSPADRGDAVLRRMSGIPLEHLLGWAGFCGLRIAVDPGVFVPRLRTGLLVREAVAALQTSLAPGTSRGRYDAGLPPVVVDLCCGSGAVGAAVAAAVGASSGGVTEPSFGVAGIELHAADVDPAAVSCARKNIVPVGGQVHQGDLFSALPAHLRGRVRVLAVNAPYVPTEAISTMPPEAREYESHAALDGGTDGLDFHRRLASEAPEWLEPGGCIIVETSGGQAARTAELLAAAGFSTRTVQSGELDGTVVVGSWPG
ncbi:putative protein N(5)-glutamine methyltransferase [Pseudarthrobacter sp. J75]|uniref:putative protein N(5)-glutamine methyltransferase n=1 Tax=unclassified Pseudarthrobacter TaxID=2647000 RepID=UPI002E7FC9C1|nr:MULTISPECIES: putative protein N(5)-glutamine methyltransferase [unclassified Pseudarthrobacter]MEE2521903.1 putative protein N(5)-glutamine methyltransferase [Pseudarthrobacter sp. J47]MEE2528828.1 putative protein N(5)-glutamine methyltransferase [Pseudarthrobacter sp. J75]MEE2569975.1 putative protein N(5)-glutamine methyltransferase [Pseudarthrobacter sp. J64]